MTTKRSAAAATIFSRRWAPPPPLISQPSGVTSSVPSIAMSSRVELSNSSTGMPSSRACSSVATEVATQRMPLRPRRGDRRQQVGDRRAGPQADGHPVLDQLRRRLRRQPLLGVRLAHRPGTLCSAANGRADLAYRRARASRGRCALTGERTVVGRSPEADVHIEDEAVSWNHLEIERRGEVLMATDLDSRNGTALNGEPLDRPRRLRDGDTLIVGGHRLEISDPAGGQGGATVAAAEPVRRAERGGAGDRRGAGRALPQRGRLRRPSRHPGRDRRDAPRQRAHRPAPPRRARRQARHPRRRRPRPPAPDRRPRDRARPRPPHR